MTYIIDNPLKGALVSLLGTSQNLDNQHRYMVIYRPFNIRQPLHACRVCKGGRGA